MSELQIIIDKALIELVGRILVLSKEYDAEDYFNCGEEHPESKVQWIVDQLKK